MEKNKKKDQTSKKKQKQNILFASCAGVAVVLIIVCAIFIGSSVKGLMGGGRESNTISGNKLYNLATDATEYQKEVYKELNEALKNSPKEVDNFKVAGLIGKSFVADFYTWTNKDGSFDVGGLQFVYSPRHLNISIQARDQFYRDFNLYVEQFGKENLLEVNDIQVKTDYAEGFVIDDKTYPAYYVSLDWTYKPSSKINVDEFQNKCYVIVIKNGDRFEIVSSYGR